MPSNDEPEHSLAVTEVNDIGPLCPHCGTRSIIQRCVNWRGIGVAIYVRTWERPRYDGYTETDLRTMLDRVCQAVNPIREEDDADVPAAGQEPHKPTGLDVTPPAVGPQNPAAGVSDEAVQVAFNATGLYGYPLGCGATAIRCVMDMLTAALPYLRRA